MLVTEKVFGFLLAALGVQLVLNGLLDVGVISVLHHEAQALLRRRKRSAMASQ